MAKIQIEMKVEGVSSTQAPPIRRMKITAQLAGQGGAGPKPPKPKRT